MKRRIVVYISGPYSGPDREAIAANIAAARAVAVELWDAGYTAICPHTNTIHFENDCACGWDDYLAGDCELIARSDVVLMLPGWQDSRGAVHERAHALALDIPCVAQLGEIDEALLRKSEEARETGPGCPSSCEE